MTTLRYVVFGQPIPVADTHRREPRFEAEDGWSITRDESTETWRIVGHGVDFVTDGINSWAPTEATLAMFERTLDETRESGMKLTSWSDVKAGKKKR